MKKFIFLHVGYETPTKEIINAWMKWFESIKAHTIDSGNPFKPGKEVTKTGIKDLPLDKNALAGYTIIQAENIDEAVKLAQSCPMITSMRVYEAASM
jgi:hypothetical protein